MRRSSVAPPTDMATRLDVRGPGLEHRAEALSGGNQQKVVLARWLLRECAVLLVDEPTRGIDAGATLAIHAVLRDAGRARHGARHRLQRTRGTHDALRPHRGAVLADG